MWVLFHEKMRKMIHIESAVLLFKIHYMISFCDFPHPFMFENIIVGSWVLSELIYFNGDCLISPGMCSISTSISLIMVESVKIFINDVSNEPPHGKTNNLHRQKQRGRSASQKDRSASLFSLYR